MTNESVPEKQTWMSLMGVTVTLTVLAVLSLRVGIHLYSHMPFVSDLCMAVGVNCTALIGAELASLHAKR